MGDDLSTYDNHFPDGCPPEGARPADNVLVFRFWGTNPPGDKDRLTYYEDNPERWKDDCEARGLSVFVSTPAAREAQRKSSYLRKKKHLMAATIPSGAGVIKRTSEKTGHHTL